ncbi:potassium transporter TrkA [Natronorarus salvus]|uniref:potassium transporter TrkA n=1 Tax=Natronorarus salvus TaxID=3117733 RepID=UPI002F26D185
MSATVEAIRLVGLAALSGVVAGGVAVGWRWYTRERLPGRLAVLVGLSAVALVLNSVVALSQFIDVGPDPLSVTRALLTVATFVAAGGTALAGRGLGDRFAENSTALVGARAVDGEVSPLVTTVGRLITVDLPTPVEDAEGYEPISEDRKAALAGKTLLFPRGLTVSELEGRFETRLREDYGVGYTDVSIEPDGTITHLAVGRRASGLGAGLPGGTVAVAVRADPAPEAGPGDRVALWTGDGDPTRLCTGEVRSVSGDVVSVAVRSERASALDRETHYRLVTLPRRERPERELATLFERAGWGVDVVEVGEGREGWSVGAIGGSVVAVEFDTGVELSPGPDRPLEAGERLYVIERTERKEGRLGAFRPR